MVITPVEASCFIKHYQSFLEAIADPGDSAGKSVIAKLALARKRYAADRRVFGVWREKSTRLDGTCLDSEILDAIERVQIGRWIYLKDTRSYSVLIREDGEAAYAVAGLTERLRNIAGHSGIVVTCGVFALGERYVCDGILDQPLTLGRNYMASFKANYEALCRSGRFYKSPPCGAPIGGASFP